jgi:hypothetical protein
MVVRRSPSVAQCLRQYGREFIADSVHRDIPSVRMQELANALEILIRAEISDPDRCKAFWEGIPAARKGCPEKGHFEKDENIWAYAFVHLLDRYLRVWEVLRWLVRAHVLPLPRKLAVLDIGSGPAPALYAISDFYQALKEYARVKDIGCLAIDDPELNAIELSRGMRRVFHALSEVAGRRGPFGAVLDDFGLFDLRSLRAQDLLSATSYYDPEERTYIREPLVASLKQWANELHRYQLIFFSNFLTEVGLVERFRQQIQLAFREQKPGGVVAVLGGIGDPYPGIYSEIEAIAGTSGHRRVTGIPEEIDDSFRRTYFPLLKAVGSAVWSHLEKNAEGIILPRVGYPPYWDAHKPIEELKSFAVRVYRKGGRSRRQAPNTFSRADG